MTTWVFDTANFDLSHIETIAQVIFDNIKNVVRINDLRTVVGNIKYELVLDGASTETKSQTRMKRDKQYSKLKNKLLNDLIAAKFAKNLVLIKKLRIDLARLFKISAEVQEQVAHKVKSMLEIYDDKLEVRIHKRHDEEAENVMFLLGIKMLI